MSMRSAIGFLLVATLASTGCVKKMAVNALSNAMAGDTGGSFTQDDDLQFVGDAIPFALKLMESLHDANPEHVGLNETLCSGYTQYAMVYVSWPAEEVRYDDFDAYEAGTARTRKFLRRAEGYCMGGLDLLHPGFSDQIYADPDLALADFTVDDVPFLYWTGAAWLARISISKEDMEAIGELPLAAALLQRALALDEDWDNGSIHDLMILLEPSLPMPGGLERAREHYERAVELSGGTRASPYVSLGTSVSVTTQNREEFVSLMEKALEVDPAAHPEDQLANLYAQEQARFYLEHLDDLFIE